MGQIAPTLPRRRACVYVSSPQREGRQVPADFADHYLRRKPNKARSDIVGGLSGRRVLQSKR
jgi:hypothetical protein